VIQYLESLLRVQIESRRGRDFLHSSRTALEPIQTPAKWTPFLLQEVKRSRRCVNHPPPSSDEVKERVELYLYFPSGPSRPVLGRPIPVPLSYYLEFRFRLSSHLWLSPKFVNQSSTRISHLCMHVPCIWSPFRRRTGKLRRKNKSV
jgi:hypothetical protein